MLRRILSRLLDENEFLSPYGIRALSRYLPAESDTGMFGGNSNWRGPIWNPAALQAMLSQRVHPVA